MNCHVLKERAYLEVSLLTQTLLGSSFRSGKADTDESISC